MRKKRYREKLESYPRWAREEIKVDYLNKLSAAEKEWLCKFNEVTYGANPEFLEDLTGKKVDNVQRRKVWRETAARRRSAGRDAMNSKIGEELDETKNNERGGLAEDAAIAKMDRVAAILRRRRR